MLDLVDLTHAAASKRPKHPVRTDNLSFRKTHDGYFTKIGPAGATGVSPVAISPLRYCRIINVPIRRRTV